MSKMNDASAPMGPPPYPPPNYSQATEQLPAPGLASQPQTIITTIIPVGPNSTRMICPSCHGEISTTTRTEPGTIAYLSGLVIGLLGGWCGCCLIPCCIDDCMDVHHNCPNCKAYLGRYRR